MSKNILKGLALIIPLTLLIMLTAVPVLAFDARTGNTVTIASGEVINDDLYIAGEAIIIDGTVNGDLWAAGGEIIVSGTVSRSLMAVGRTVNISGDVDHAVRVAGTTINITGNVNGDLMAFGGELTIASTARINGDLLLGAGTARIDGLVEGDIKGGGGDVTVGNGVKGNVELEVDSLTIVSTANIEGDLTYTSEEEADIQSGAQIAGTTTHKLPEVKEEPGLLATVRGKLISFLMAMVTGLAIILLAPRRLRSIAEAIRSRPGPSAGWGALILFVTPIAAVVVCITIVGIPLGLIALALYLIAIYLAQIPVGLFLGSWIVRRSKPVEGKAIMFGAFTLGLVILRLLALIPYVGFFIGLVVTLFGLGAVVASERKRRAEAREAAST